MELSLQSNYSQYLIVGVVEENVAFNQRLSYRHDYTNASWLRKSYVLLGRGRVYWKRYLWNKIDGDDSDCCKH